VIAYSLAYFSFLYIKDILPATKQANSGRESVRVKKTERNWYLLRDIKEHRFSTSHTLHLISAIVAQHLRFARHQQSKTPCAVLKVSWSDASFCWLRKPHSNKKVACVVGMRQMKNPSNKNNMKRLRWWCSNALDLIVRIYLEGLRFRQLQLWFVQFHRKTVPTNLLKWVL
jgi:hypothetical protein